MKSSFVSLALAALLFGCSGTATPTATASPAAAPATTPTAEALMRSRYAAYALGRSAYLLATWHPDTRPASLTLEPGLRWIGLQVEASEISEPDRAIVRFTARYRLGGRAARLSETSRFTRIDGRWYYVDGDVDDPAPSSR